MFERFAHVVVFLITASAVEFSEILGNHGVGFGISFHAIDYSAAAYCSYPSLKSWTCGNACSKNSAFKEVTQHLNTAKNTFAFSGFDPWTDIIVLAFRGTNSDADM